MTGPWGGDDFITLTNTRTRTLLCVRPARAGPPIGNVGPTPSIFASTLLFSVGGSYRRLRVDGSRVPPEKFNSMTAVRCRSCAQTWRVPSFFFFFSFRYNRFGSSQRQYFFFLKKKYKHKQYEDYKFYLTPTYATVTWQANNVPIFFFLWAPRQTQLVKGNAAKLPLFRNYFVCL